MSVEWVDNEGETIQVPLADQVFETLRGWIVNGDLRQGQRLRIRELSERVGTSAMPVREAVRRLVESGLAVSEPYKGARVRELDVNELEHAYDIRILLEGECARIGAHQAVLGVADRMEEHWELLRQAVIDGRIGDALACDEALLDELYGATGNTVAIGIIHGLWQLCRPYKLMWVASAGPTHMDMWGSKPELIAAVRSNDARRAEESLRTSYRRAKDSLKEILADR